MARFPIFVDLGPRAPLVVGGGELALAKARLLLTRAETVEIAADFLCSGLRDLVIAHRVRQIASHPDESDVRGRPLIISATDDDTEDARVSQMARTIGVPINVPDCPSLSTFALPAIVDRGTVTVAIGTEGAAPVLATRLRAQLEAELHPRLGHLADIAGSYRKRVAATISSPRMRRRFWDAVFGGPAADAALRGNDEDARRLMDAELDATARETKRPGHVLLVGAGPGAPDLLTMRAIRALKQADVIVHDGLMGSAVLEHARREAKLISVAKSRGRHSRTQAEINALLISLAREGRTVVRLKGGDPSIFGRSGEEIEALSAAAISLEVIPGITAASAAAASLQITLTQRNVSRAIVFLTGHAAALEDLETRNLRWLPSEETTLAVYMGLATAPQFAMNLIRRGWPASTPVVAVSRISQNDERRVATCLHDIVNAEPLHALSGPTLLIIGDVTRNCAVQMSASPIPSEHPATHHSQPEAA